MPLADSGEQSPCRGCARRGDEKERCVQYCTMIQAYRRQSQGIALAAADMPPPENRPSQAKDVRGVQGVKGDVVYRDGRVRVAPGTRCIAPGCTRSVYSKRMCKSHYTTAKNRRDRWRRLVWNKRLAEYVLEQLVNEMWMQFSRHKGAALIAALREYLDVSDVRQLSIEQPMVCKRCFGRADLRADCPRCTGLGWVIREAA